MHSRRVNGPTSAAMERVRRAAILMLLAAAVLSVSLPAAAEADVVGRWRNFTGSTGTNLTQVSLLTTPDGRLHVAWYGPSLTPGRDDLMYRTIKAPGAFGSKERVQTAWAALNDPAILYDPLSGAIGLVFSGVRDAYPGDPYQRMTVTTSFNGGSTWLLSTNLIDPPTSTSRTSPVAGAIAGNALFATWYGSSGVWVHRGLDSATPAYEYQSSLGLGSFGYHSAFGLERAGYLWLVWASSATGVGTLLPAHGGVHEGLYAQMVELATGAPIGTRYKLSRSTTRWAGAQRFSMMSSRVPVTGRTRGSGVFVAYPTGYPSTKTVRLWKVTASRQTSVVVAAGSAKKGQTAVAAGPDGRVWVAWSQRARGRWKVVVRRSNASVTRWGPTKAYRLPYGYRVVWHLAAAVRKGKLDVLAHAGGGSKGDATLHIRIRAPR